jgi:protoporphyrinogen oxidase
MTTLTADFGVLGGGIAGLTMAREIARTGRSVVLIEKDTEVGGLSRTIRRDGFSFDLGGHRFHSNNPDVVAWLRGLMGNDLSTVPRRSRICIEGRFVDYPLRLGQAAAAFGPAKATAIAASYVRALLARRNGLDRSFEDWVIRRFGQVLYGIYFRPYTEKVWGIPCRELSADWASQRISLPSLPQAVYRAIVPTRNPPATIVPNFLYPRGGYGAIGDRLAEEIVRAGGRVECETAVRRIDAGGSDVRVSVAGRSGSVDTLQCGRVISTIPIHALLAALSHEPDVARVAVDSALPYRGVMLVFLAVDRPQVSADSWTYFPDSALLFGRTHEPKNWSAKLVPRPDVTSLAVEIFASPGDGTWEAPDHDLVARTVEELTRVGWLRASEVLGSWVVRVPHAYPVYGLDYRARRDRTLAVVGRWARLSLVGRTGAFSYRNVDGVVEDCFHLARHLGLDADASVSRLAADSGRWV